MSKANKLVTAAAAFGAVLGVASQSEAGGSKHQPPQQPTVPTTTWNNNNANHNANTNQNLNTNTNKNYNLNSNSNSNWNNNSNKNNNANTNHNSATGGTGIGMGGTGVGYGGAGGQGGVGYGGAGGNAASTSGATATGGAGGNATSGANASVGNVGGGSATATTGASTSSATGGNSSGQSVNFNSKYQAAAYAPSMVLAHGGQCPSGISFSLGFVQATGGIGFADQHEGCMDRNMAVQFAEMGYRNLDKKLSAFAIATAAYASENAKQALVGVSRVYRDCGNAIDPVMAAGIAIGGGECPAYEVRERQVRHHAKPPRPVRIAASKDVDVCAKAQARANEAQVMVARMCPAPALNK